MAAARAVMPNGLAWQDSQGQVLGLYLHGMFEDAGVLQALFAAPVASLDSVFDGLADCVDREFPPSFLDDLLRDPGRG
jgi:adenosylcobyric acid synthase